MTRTDEPELLGQVTCPSGTLLVVDMGLLGLWSHLDPPRRHVDLEIAEGKVAQTDPVGEVTVRAAATASGTLEVGGATLCGFATGWGDGLYPVERHLSGDGRLLRDRILLAAD